MAGSSSSHIRRSRSMWSPPGMALDSNCAPNIAPTIDFGHRFRIKVLAEVAFNDCPPALSRHRLHPVGTDAGDRFIESAQGEGQSLGRACPFVGTESVRD